MPIAKGPNSNSGSIRAPLDQARTAAGTGEQNKVS